MRRIWAAGWVLLCACSKAPPTSEIRPEPSPSSVISSAPRSEPVALALDAKGARYGEQLLVRFSEDRSKGAEESQKRQGPNDLFLVPVEAWLRDRRSEGRLGSALTLVVQRETPYRGLLEVMFTAGQSEIGAFDLYETSASGRLLHIEPPRALTREQIEQLRETSALNLVLVIVADGVGIKASSGNVAPGCREVGKGLAVPRVEGKLDHAAVEACVRSLKAAKPSFATEDTVTMTAEPGLPVGELFDLALTLRGTTEAPLAPKVQLGLAR